MNAGFLVFSIMKFMRRSFIDKLAFIEIKNKKVLVTLSRGKDTWYIPGGKREGNETDEEALIREVKEELDVTLLPSTITSYATFDAPAHGKPEGTIVRMTCYRAHFEGVMKPSGEIDRLDYFSFDKKHLTAQVDQIIFDDLKKKDLII